MVSLHEDEPAVPVDVAPLQREELSPARMPVRSAQRIQRCQRGYSAAAVATRCAASSRGDPAGDCRDRLRAYAPGRAVRFLLESPSIRGDDDRGDRITTVWDTRGFAAHYSFDG